MGHATDCILACFHRSHDAFEWLIRAFHLTAVSDADEMAHVEAVNILRNCEINPSRFPLSLASSQSHRFNFNWIVTKMKVPWPKV